MKLAIMQPYFFPYLGYFQLIQAADNFVVYDDVQYIKGGWINRNYILGQGQKQRFGLPIEKASPNKRIHELALCVKDHKLLKSIALNYANAPFYKDVYPLVVEVLAYPDRNLARFLEHSLKKVSAYLGLERVWHVASLLEKKSGQTGQARILDICTSWVQKSTSICRGALTYTPPPILGHMAYNCLFYSHE